MSQPYANVSRNTPDREDPTQTMTFQKESSDDRQQLEALASCVQGRLVTPDDPTYAADHVLWNASFKGHPAAVVHCVNVEDVQAVITFAREHAMPLSVRSGGHSLAGFETNDAGLVLDLSAMKKIQIDPILRTARLEPGLTWSEVANALQPYGLALTAGDTGSVGVGGLLLGGGIGWMVRKYGLAIDHVRAVELVTAEGQLVRASAEEHPELFWGLRGGGGNFGVVTAFEVDVHPGGTILGGAIFFDATEAEHIMQNYVRIASEAPDELSTEALLILAPPAPFIPVDKQGKPVVLIMLCYAGDINEGERVVAPLRELATPIIDLIAPIPYPEIFPFNAIGEVRGMQHHADTFFVENISQELVHTLVDAAEGVMSAETLIQFRVLGGAMSRIKNDATAFAHRDKPGMVMVTLFGPTSHDAASLEARKQQFMQALSPYANGAYVNYLMDRSEQEVHRAYPPATYARLAALKRQYDPTNLFRFNQNILPHPEQ
ncbi:FAD-binding oxidoreductase [Dictyobacter aurantiacus]|uniref:FAD-linked oxidase n=1 Tax=Dictyobacter aurantiacus TaxID=1936993 RepID=A0A401ZT69_9CHLR|nr:FAD-binding oxidoreductase [Dictyobacter aurantiacus]GCE10002.1 FAD-linked oxidase [Dictyobacter aurantiacus]